MELIDELTSIRGKHCVSIYLDCSHDVPETTLTFATRFKNILREIRNARQDSGSKELCARLSELVPDLQRRAQQHRGLAIFCTPERLWTVDLPFVVEDHLHQGDRFALKPLLAAWSDPVDYYVLALSQHSVRLLRLRPNGHELVPLDASLPLDMDAATPTLRDRSLNFHGTNNHRATYHGEDAPARRQPEDEKRFLRAVITATDKALEGTNGARIIIAAVEEWASALRRLASDQLPLVQETMAGSPEGHSETELARLAHAVAERDRAVQEEQMLSRVSAEKQPDKVVSDIHDLITAAADGRVETLVLSRGTAIWGLFDAETRSVTLSDPKDANAEDLLDVVAVETFQKGGTVHLVAPERLQQSPEPAIAVLRY